MRARDRFTMWIFVMFIMACVMMMSFLAVAQTPDPSTPISYDQLFTNFMGSLTLANFKGLALVGTIVQFVIWVLDTPLGTKIGAWRIGIVSALSIVGGVVALKLSGATWGGAFANSATLAAIQVYVHQLWNQFITKQNEPTEAQAGAALLAQAKSQGTSAPVSK